MQLRHVLLLQLRKDMAAEEVIAGRVACHGSAQVVLLAALPPGVAAAAFPPGGAAAMEFGEGWS